MEVFLSGLPEQGNLTSKGLSSQLEPFLLGLGISSNAWDCEKPTRKTFAFLTFPRLADAEKFLGRYGSVFQPRSKPTSRLMILGAAVLCKPSNKSAQEVKFKVKSLEFRRTNEARQSSVSNSRDVGQQQRSDTAFQVLEVQCGHYMFLDSLDEQYLAFIPEINLHTHLGGLGGVSGTALAKFTKKNIILKFGRNQIRIPFNSVNDLIWSPAGHVTVQLSTVPQFFTSQDPTVEQLFARINLSRGVPPIKLNRVTSFSREHEAVAGVCLVYRFSVVPPGLVPKIRDLETKRVFEVTRFELPVRRVGAGLEGMKASLDRMASNLRHYFQLGSLPFDILFQLQSLAYKAYLHPTVVLEVARELVRLRETKKEPAYRHVSMEAVKKLSSTPFPGPYEDPSLFSPKAIVSYLMEQEALIRKEKYFKAMTLSGNNMAKIHRVTVTPSRILLQGPELENQNRILRKFPNHHDYFIRVQFSDENGQDMRFNPRYDTTSIYERFRDVLNRGIPLAGRTYTFLGWSHSSLRSHSIWFCAPFVGDSGELNTYFSIIAALGNFTGIQSPARCAARIGQAFSETPFTVPLDDNDILVARIPDIKSWNGSRVFSDGVGKISEEALRIVWSCLPHDNHVSPTCLQIRWGGSKGMLALDTRLTGKQMHVRDSMVKFESEDTRNLEICADTASKAIPLVLNRQMIKILEDMGVPDSFFFALQDLALESLQTITSYPIKTAGFLRRQAVGASLKLHKLVRTAHNAGIDYRKEDFLRRVVETVVLKELRLLKHKARIPAQLGVTLFGVVDETGYLRKDEVFVTYDPSLGKGALEPPPSAGQVLVTRSPALHPGDIQFARNVIPPPDSPLRMLKNCIIFSAQGDRDLPSQLSGGDLDGDIYNIIWDKRALFKNNGTYVKTFPPADYPRVSPKDIGRPVEKSDMTDFFVDFMKNDQLGVIATRHMIIADQDPEGTLASNCIILAELHSTAVDFSKTGIPVQFNMLPRSNKARPDFLAPGPIVHLHDKAEIELADLELEPFDDDEDADGPGYEYYMSDKILGKLYRAIDEKQIWRDDIHVAVPSGKPTFWSAFVSYVFERCEELGIEQVDWEGKTETAKSIRSAYDDSMYSAMTNYADNAMKPLTEIEVFIGSIISSTGSQTHRQRDKSQKLRDEFGRISKWILSQMRQGIDIPATGYATDFDRLELCMACLMISTLDGLDGLRRGQRRARVGDGEMQSFSLVAASAVLAELDHLSAT